MAFREDFFYNCLEIMQFRETLTSNFRRFECIVPPLALQGGAIKTDLTFMKLLIEICESFGSKDQIWAWHLIDI